MAENNTTKNNLLVKNLRDSNISKYINLMSDDEILKALLSRDTTTIKKEENLKSSNEDALSAVSDVLQSITTEAMTTSEILEMLYTKYDEPVITELGKFIKIVHAKDYKIVNDKKLSGTPFSLKYEAPEYKNGKYIHDSTYGLLSGKAIASALKKGKNKKIDLSIVKEEMATLAKTKNASISKEDAIYSIDSIINRKIAKVSKQSNTASTDKDEVAGEIVFVNKVDDNEKIIANKSNPSLSYILMDSADLRIGTRNSLELSTFFNTLSTIELSKCQPYFNAVFILPGVVSNSVSQNTFKTASITQFFDGTPYSQELTTDTYSKLEASFVRTLKKQNNVIKQSAVATNLSAFTMPQTINKFDEVYVGHNENIDFYANSKFKRVTSIHDYTRPFLTIKSFDIDVAPTQGLMSFKTGRLSLVLHDRTRMADIAPFIKPDLFGSFGAEIAIEYGWSHIDAGGNINYLGEFLNNSRVTEKYIITNSSFNMDKNGQVNIDLSIAMRGPIDIKGVMLTSDPPTTIAKQKVNNKIEAFNTAKNKISGVNFYTTAATNYIQSLIKSITGEDTNSIDQQTLKEIRNFLKIYKKSKSALTREIKAAKSLEAISASLNKNIFKESITASKNTISIVSDTVEKKQEAEEPQTASTTTTPADITPETLASVRSLFIGKSNPLSQIMSALQNISSAKGKDKAERNSLIEKIMGGLDIVDPFYNKEWLKQYNRIITRDSIDPDNVGLGVTGVGGGKGTNYVTLGSFVSGLIGTHMACTGKFDEVQIVSYTTNENCGLMSNLNVSSLLIPRKDLKEFLESLFKNGTSMSIESVLSQTIQRFITTRLQVCYGLAEFYETDSANNTVMRANYRKNKKNGAEALKSDVNKKLVEIYTLLAKEKENLKGFKPKLISGEDVKFVIPKVKFTFDTITSRKQGFQRTICRVSIFDQNDNPFGSVHTIMKNFQDEEGIVRIATKLNKLRADYKSKLTTANGKNSQKSVKEKFYKKQNEILKRLEDEGVLIKTSEEDVYTIKDAFQLDTIKNSIKNIMPSITYGSQNSAIIDASVSTVNEAKLNTVYLTRSDRNAKGKQISAKVQFQKDLPLRVLPSQATITMFGCPFVNFAQYLFLDFETGTTVDNAYAVTGIKHSLSPGKFTTSLTLSYGDVYGKYENAAKTLAREIEDKTKQKSNRSNTEKEIEKPKTKLIVDYVTKNPSNKRLDDLSFAKTAQKTFSIFNTKINIETYFYYYDKTLLYIKKENVSDNEINLTAHHFIDFDKDKNKEIKIDIDLFKLKGIKEKLINEKLIKELNKIVETNYEVDEVMNLNLNTALSKANIIKSKDNKTIKLFNELDKFVKEVIEDSIGAKFKYSYSLDSSKNVTQNKNIEVVFNNKTISDNIIKSNLSASLSTDITDQKAKSIKEVNILGVENSKLIIEIEYINNKKKKVTKEIKLNIESIIKRSFADFNQLNN